MACVKTTALQGSSLLTGKTRYSKQEDCLAACKEGACCEGTTCSVKPQCQCQGTGKTFKGVGTVCKPNPCDPCCQGVFQPSTIYLQITSANRARLDSISLSFELLGTYALNGEPFPQNISQCYGYGGLFYENPTICGTQANKCFTGCTHKLQLAVSPSGLVSVGVCDSQATFLPGGTGGEIGVTPGGTVSAGGEVWGYISEWWPAKVCARTPVSGTTTQRSNPNYGGVLNAISYTISFA